MGWVVLDRVVHLTTLMLLVLMIVIIFDNNHTTEDVGNFSLKLDNFKQEMIGVMTKNIDYSDRRVNNLAETQDRYQVSTDQRVYVLEQQMKVIQADKKNSQKIINNNNSNAVIYNKE